MNFYEISRLHFVTLEMTGGNNSFRSRDMKRLFISLEMKKFKNFSFFSCYVKKLLYFCSVLDD